MDRGKKKREDERGIGQMNGESTNEWGEHKWLLRTHMDEEWTEERGNMEGERTYGIHKG